MKPKNILIYSLLLISLISSTLFAQEEIILKRYRHKASGIIYEIVKNNNNELMLRAELNYFLNKFDQNSKLDKAARLAASVEAGRVFLMARVMNKFKNRQVLNTNNGQIIKTQDTLHAYAVRWENLNNGKQYVILILAEGFNYTP